MESTNTFVPIEMLSSEGDDTTESKQGEAEANAPDSDQNTKKDEPEASNLEIRKPSQRWVLPGMQDVLNKHLDQIIS